MSEEMLCPLFHGYCQKECAIWDHGEDCCSIVSLAEGAKRMRDIERELYEIRRHLEVSTQCHCGF